MLGAITANGGNSSDGVNIGGGGGGRVAVWRLVHEDFNTDNVSVAAGSGGSPSPVAGTIYWGDNAPAGTVITIR